MTWTKERHEAARGRGDQRDCLTCGHHEIGPTPEACMPCVEPDDVQYTPGDLHAALDRIEELEAAPPPLPCDGCMHDDGDYSQQPCQPCSRNPYMPDEYQAAKP